MLNRFISWEGFRSIPLTGNRYLISINGDIIDTFSGIKSSSGLNDFIEIFDGISFKLYKRSVLVALVSKKCCIPFKYWLQLDTMALDGNDDNTNVSNLVWKFPDNGLSVTDKTDFKYIPGFTRYSINKDGVVFSHVSMKILSPYQDEMGYWMYGCQPDIGKRTIVGKHRLLALAFLSYPVNVDYLDVNHKDGIKPNCCLSNLEWGSRKYNCDHAYSTGLRTDNIEISVKNAFTDEIQNYYSFEDCARKLGIDGETVRLRVKSAGQIVYLPGLQFKRKDDYTDWKIFEDPSAELLRSGVSREMFVKNTVTGEEFIFDSINSCAKFLNLKRSTLGWKIKNHPGKAIDNFVLINKPSNTSKISLIDL